jgi:glutaredoxin-related protein
MSRLLLPSDRVTPAVAAKQAAFHAEVVAEVEALVAREAVVVIGMGWNPHVGAVRRALDEAGIAHVGRDFGNYLSMWRPRLAIKLWSGWPTFPQVFVNGVLVGGNTDVRKALADGSLAVLLARGRVTTPG